MTQSIALATDASRLFEMHRLSSQAGTLSIARLLPGVQLEERRTAGLRQNPN